MLRFIGGGVEIRVGRENLKYGSSPPSQRTFSIKSAPNDHVGFRNQGRLGKSQILDFSATTDSFDQKCTDFPGGGVEIRVEWENLKYRTSPPPQRIFSIKTAPNDHGGVRNQGRLGKSQILDFSSATTDFRPKLHRFIQSEVKPGSVGKISATSDFFDQNCADLSKGECKTGVCWEYPNKYGTSTRRPRIFDQKCIDLPGRVSNKGPLFRYSGFFQSKLHRFTKGGFETMVG